MKKVETDRKPEKPPSWRRKEHADQEKKKKKKTVQTQGTEGTTYGPSPGPRVEGRRKS